jgi:hypothetical protein
VPQGRLRSRPRDGTRNVNPRSMSR